MSVLALAFHIIAASQATNCAFSSQMSELSCHLLSSLASDQVAQWLTESWENPGLPNLQTRWLNRKIFENVILCRHDLYLCLLLFQLSLGTWWWRDRWREFQCKASAYVGLGPSLIPCFAFTPHLGLFLSSIPNLKLNEERPVVAVKGKSLLPYCHFELEDSDYITANRRNSDLRGPGGMSLDPQTKVIEFTSVGVHVKNSRWASSQQKNVL